MQTKLICAGTALLGVAGYYTYLNYHYALTGTMYISGIVFIVIAAFKKDIKDTKKETTRELVSPEEQEKLIALIKVNCNSKYQLRNNKFNNKFQSIAIDYSSRGFDILPGAAFRQFADLYIEELHSYTDILLTAISGILSNGRVKLKTEPLILFSQELIQNKADEFNSHFCNLIDHHSQFHQGPQPDIMIRTKTSFTTRINKEAGLNISRISSQIEMENMA